MMLVLLTPPTAITLLSALTRPAVSTIKGVLLALARPAVMFVVIDVLNVIPATDSTSSNA